MSALIDAVCSVLTHDGTAEVLVAPVPVAFKVEAVVVGATADGTAAGTTELTSENTP